MNVHLVNPSAVSFGTAVITPRWQYVLAGATPRTFVDPILVDETLFPIDSFFSSRRRHTSTLRDWSSDVCSYDLAAASRINAERSCTNDADSVAVPAMSAARSEERRVGKECRSRWSQHH